MPGTGNVASHPGLIIMYLRMKLDFFIMTVFTKYLLYVYLFNAYVGGSTYVVAYL